MKLLFDQNLSHKLVTRLADLYPDSHHVRSRGLKEADDSTVWSYAAREEFILVTKDEDFHARSILHGHPPKVLWIRSGNCSTDLVSNCSRPLRTRGSWLCTESAMRLGTRVATKPGSAKKSGGDEPRRSHGYASIRGQGRGLGNR